jgi:type II secretory pathway component PulK
VVSIVALMTVIVTEVVHAASVRIRMAAAERDEAVAEALAGSGVQIYRLILIGSKQLDNSPVMTMLRQQVATMGLPLPNANQLWQLMPSIASAPLRFLVVADGDEEEAAELMRRAQRTGDEPERVETSLRKSFLDFDGDFVAEVRDEESRIFVGRFRAQAFSQLQTDVHASLLFATMSGFDNDDWFRERDLDRWDLISNLADWTDPDDLRIFRGGQENSLYDRGDDPYFAKNGPFDTPEEIRLVAGWERDAVWQRFGRHLTMFGQGKVNVNTAPRRVLEGLIRRYVIPQPSDDAVRLVADAIDDFRSLPPLLGGGIMSDPQGFVNILQQLIPGQIDQQGLISAITTTSSVFRVTSTGSMGNASVTITAVFDFTTSPVGKVVYWRVE